MTEKRAADRIRTGTARITTSDAAVTPQPPRSGDDRTRTGGLSPDKRALSLLSYAPVCMARVGFEPTSRAHEAREDAAPPPRVAHERAQTRGLAGRSRTC